MYCFCFISKWENNTHCKLTCYIFTYQLFCLSFNLLPIISVYSHSVISTWVTSLCFFFRRLGVLQSTLSTFYLKKSGPTEISADCIQSDLVHLFDEMLQMSFHTFAHYVETNKAVSFRKPL